MKPRSWKAEEQFALGFFYPKIPATKWAVGWERFTCLIQESYPLSMNNKPDAINKQDKDTDIQYKDEQAMGTGQKLFEAGYQKVCNDDNGEWQEDGN